MNTHDNEVNHTDPHFALANTLLEDLWSPPQALED